jgi:4-hydroxy-tetrahydrodipicolinate reductase
MIKLSLVGYGKMGKEIEKLIKPDEFVLTEKFDIDRTLENYFNDKPDVAIEFSTPITVISNIEFLSSKGVNVVCGTTGWYDKIEVIKSMVNKYNTGFIYGSNFSIGVNIFFEFVKKASELIDKYKQYEINIEETHHTQKLDKPSGTAIRIAENLINGIKRKEKYTSDAKNNDVNEINIVSKRIENVVGNHKVFFDGPGDTITLEHNAKSRRGFAEGALLAAKFIHNKKGFYKFEDIFNNLT